jgi:outer membrane lipoprotein-sorting protein
MRFVRTDVSIFLCFVLAVNAFGQQTVTTAAPQRDPQALGVLQQSLNAAGGMSAVSSVQDLTGAGTITYQWAGTAVQGQLTVYGKGPNQFRIDSNLSAETQRFVVNEGAGTLIQVNGQKIVLSSYSVMNAGNLTLPSAKIALAISDPSTSAEYLGLVNWNGSRVYQVQITRSIDAALNSSGAFPGLGSFQLYIDPTSYQVVGLAETVWWNADAGHPYLHELIFSNYGQANGLSLPFTITEKFAGQQTWSLTLTSIMFNTGISDSLFNL